MKAEAKIRYIGITTSHGRDHDELYQALSNNPFDFVQLSSNIRNRAEAGQGDRSRVSTGYFVNPPASLDSDRVIWSDRALDRSG
jgi:hypothetical protein